VFNRETASYRAEATAALAAGDVYTVECAPSDDATTVSMRSGGSMNFLPDPIQLTQTTRMTLTMGTGTTYAQGGVVIQLTRPGAAARDIWVEVYITPSEA